MNWKAFGRNRGTIPAYYLCFGCCFFLVVVFVFTLVLAVVLNRISFVFIVERCPLLLCFVYCVLFECVVTLCMCYLSFVFYCCTTATGLKPNCS
jgi:hypothetical protein